jgi:predicted O-methyltransferase YrrM
MTRGEHQVLFDNMDTSACCVSFNYLLLRALEQHDLGNADYFLLWHSDIVPENYFLDKLVKIAQEKQAGILAAVVAIKDEKGLTSTAIDEPVGDLPQYWRVRRLTMTEVMDLPPTFTHSGLLNNTGLMLVDLSQPWVRDIYFHFDDAIITHHGKRLPVVMPEDWMFSRDARKLGCKEIWATREVAADHFGVSSYPNSQRWGTMKTDLVAPTPEDIIAAVEGASSVQGWMSWEELAYLAGRAKSAKCVVEIGSWKGRSTKAMAATCRGEILAVDSWRGSTNGDATGVEADARGADTIEAEFRANLSGYGNVIPLKCEHQWAGPLLKVKAGEVDFAFIDGDHLYEHVKRDILTCLDVMAPGGILSGHDLNEEGVAKAVSELLPGATHIPGTSIWEYKVPTTDPKIAPDSSNGGSAASPVIITPSEAFKVH